VYTTLREAGIDVLLDDRKRQGIREKQDQHRFYGVDKWIMIGDDEISGGFITVESADDERQTTVEDLVQRRTGLKHRSPS
jgi:histidyl-tRNA synthetase